MIILAFSMIILLVLVSIFDELNPFYSISSGSMLPVLKQNDLVVVNKNIEFTDLQTSDIIVFNKPDDPSIILVHRIIEVNDDNSNRVIKTKGDNNPRSLEGVDYPIMEGDYIGKVVLILPNCDWLLKIIAPPVSYVVIASIGIFVLVSNGLYAGLVKRTKTTNVS